MTASCSIEPGPAVLRRNLSTGWQMAQSPEERTPHQLQDLQFIPAAVPGTAAAALPGYGASFDASEFWFRCEFENEPAALDEEVILEFGGIATLSEAWLNGKSILRSESMFARHRVDVSDLIAHRNELLIVCRPLLNALREKRLKQPRARWRTKVVSEQQLRWFRTTLLGRAPGFAPGPAPVGPWRPITLVRRRVPVNWTRRVDAEAGTIVAEIQAETKPVRGWLVSGEARAEVDWTGACGSATLRIPNARRWWPHTHGKPVLYPLRLEVEMGDGSAWSFEDTPVGFRSIEFDDGFRINGERMFSRGVVWTPLNTAIRERLELLRDGGFNLIRVAGTAVYEDETFHRLCDELGLLVWQDMMFANMDYPFGDAEFFESARAEAEAEVSRLANHSSTALICGNSEVEQQAGMLGLNASLGRGSFFGEELPRIVTACCPGIPYIPSAPSGGDQPFRVREGVANYFGVGAYMRPLEDARHANVKFASECLAFSNIPEPEIIERMSLQVPGGIAPSHPAWKRAVPRDSGTSWDFEDVRDHYLKLLYSVEPAILRHTDPRGYWDLSRVVSGEVMAEVFGEWRRGGSKCGGGIILWASDLEPGAGWGILDSDGIPKAAYWFLRRALAPCTIWMTDEGLNGVDVHVANDTSEDFTAWLRIAMYSRGERRIEEAEREIRIEAHSNTSRGFEEILGHFADVSRAYRFGPPAHDLIAASLHRNSGESAFAQTFRFPAGRSAARIPIDEMGLSAQTAQLSDGSIEVLLGTKRFANGVRVFAPNMRPDDCYFGIEPGGTRRIVLTPSHGGAAHGAIQITAVNAEGRINVPAERPA